MALTIAAIIASLGISACGGGGGGPTQSAKQNSANSAATTTRATNATPVLTTPAGVSPQTVVAQVGGRPITLATVEHSMAIASAPAPPPDPPSYSSCAARLAAEPPKSTATQSEAQRKRTCQQNYQKLLERTLLKAVHNQWLIGEAAEEGLTVTPREVRQEFYASKKAQFHSNAEFESYRKSTGQTIADMMSELRLDKLTQSIFEKIKKKEHPISGAEVARYYDSHRRQYAIPKGRALRIVRTATEGSAIKVKKEIESGKSFASVVRELSAIGQPLQAKNGEVKDLKPGVYQEKNLNDAIFRAKLNHLYGPIELTTNHKTIAPETNTGFYLFEVTGIVPGGQTPLAQVKDALAAELAAAQKARIIPGFVTAFRRKWKARTDCQPGYVVKYCRQFKASKAEEAVDLYTL